jgi:hypothetical protein
MLKLSLYFFMEKESHESYRPFAGDGLRVAEKG